MVTAADVARRYVEVWHIEDARERRRAIEALWIPAGEHYVRAREVRGYDELEARVTASHEKNVRDGGACFRIVGDVRDLRDVVTFHWEMYAVATGETESTGFEVLRVDDEGRIVCDYQFIVT